MKRTISTWAEFKKHWGGNVNFLMAGECVPFHFDMPPVEDVIEIIRKDPDARITNGVPGAALNLQSIADDFRAKPVKEVIKNRFALAHFKLPNFYGKGQLFDGFEEKVMEPWRKSLTAAGFTWNRCYPIIFISGPGCATNYHMDQSHVVAWQMYGTKVFSGLLNPETRSSLEERMKSVEFNNQKTVSPADLKESEVLSYTMRPGAVLWNAFLTPHWVGSTEGVSYSFNISHGGLKLNGQLCPYEVELEEWRAKNNKTDFKPY